jgi:hypothetical protein
VQNLSKVLHDPACTDLLDNWVHHAAVQLTFDGGGVGENLVFHITWLVSSATIGVAACPFGRR